MELLIKILQTLSTKKKFWLTPIIVVLIILIGLMVGPNQSCSRSLMAQLTPKDKINEFFGFFALTGKATSFIGPLLFGIITSIYNQQAALWVIVLFFILGLLLFSRVQFNLLNSRYAI